MTNLGLHPVKRLGSDDPLDAELTFDDATMLGFAAFAVVTAIALLVLGF